jgi:hypothetical protein
LEITPGIYNDDDGPNFTGSYCGTVTSAEQGTLPFEMKPHYDQTEDTKAKIFIAGTTRDPGEKLPDQIDDDYVKSWFVKPGNLNRAIVLTRTSQ